MPELGDIIRGKEIGYKTTIRYIWKACIDCGNPRWVEFRLHPRCDQLRCKHCGTKFAIEKTKQMKDGKHPLWKSEKRNDAGYKLIHLKSDDFFFHMADKDKYVLEHRLVMAKYMNRCLLSWEVVHHKNGIKDDNRIENLQLMSSRVYHLVDLAMKRYIYKLEKRIKQLEERVTLLEAENVLLNKDLTPTPYNRGQG